jgi:hypothetical protein
VSTVNGTIPRFADHKIQISGTAVFLGFLTETAAINCRVPLTGLSAGSFHFEIFAHSNGWGKAMFDGCHTSIFVIAPARDNRHA